MKKVVNLSSQIYKLQSTSKTPTKQKFPEPQTNPQAGSYQNICCPSCKYLFKILKDNNRSKTPPSFDKSNQGVYSNAKNSYGNMNSNRTQSAYKKDNNWQRSVEVQTEQYMIGSFKTSPKREIIGKNRNMYKIQERIERIVDRRWRMQTEEDGRGTMTDRTPERSPYFDDKLNQRMRNPMLTQRNLQQKMSLNGKGSQIQTSRRMQTSNKSNQKISTLIKKQKQKQKPQFPARSAYLNSKTPPEPSIPQKKLEGTSSYPSPIKSPQPQSPTPTKPTQTASLPTKKLDQNTIARELLNKIQLSEQINEIIDYNLNIRLEQSIPSYCKMLLYDMKDRKDMNKIKEYQKNQQQQEMVERGSSKNVGNSKEKKDHVNRVLNY